jgi:hexosaminidase
MIPFTPSSLAVRLQSAGSPFSDEVIERMKTAGIWRGEIHVNGNYIDHTQPGLARTIGRQFREAGIEMWSIHVGYGGAWDISQTDETRRRRAVDLTRGTFAACRELGASIAVVHPSAEPIPEAERALRIAQARKSLRELTEAARPPGLRLAVEILPRTCLGNTSRELFEIIGDFDPSVVGACLDSNHANIREDLSDVVRTLGNRLLTLHISDNDGLDEKHWLPGKGIICWPEFIRALADAGYRGAFVYETSNTNEDRVKGLLEIKENFANLLRGAGEK